MALINTMHISHLLTLLYRQRPACLNGLIGNKNAADFSLLLVFPHGFDLISMGVMYSQRGQQHKDTW